jgi:putative endonuclease
MRKEHRYYVYILTSISRRALYTGITNAIMRRLAQHRESGPDTFVGRYHATRLVYFEVFQDVRAAIAREKEIKGWSRMKKEELVRSKNPEWNDLSAGWGKPFVRGRARDSSDYPGF